MKLENSVVIVTGGASGLGGACVELFTSRGAKVVIADRNEESGQSLAMKTGAVFHKTNVADEASAQDCIEVARKRFGEITGLVNCAGVGFPEKMVDKDGAPHKLDTFRKTIEVNLVGTFNMTRLVAAAIAKQGGQGERGVVVNTASVAAFEGQVGQVAYSASKGGIVAMTLPLARELSQLGIRVCTIAPGIFDTPMLTGLPEKVRDSLGQQVPFPSRLGQPAEFASLAVHIFENGMLNGEVIRLDGAMRMAAR